MQTALYFFIFTSNINFYISSLYPLLYEFCYTLCLRCCYITETKAAVTDPDTEGIEYIDEGEEEENNNIDRDEETKSESFNDSDGDSVEDPGALHINSVNLKSGARERERAHLRVCVEITHPALKFPVYRTWTGTQIPFSQILWFCAIWWIAREEDRVIN